jgi:hypothetical protein
MSTARKVAAAAEAPMRGEATSSMATGESVTTSPALRAQGQGRED